MYKIFTDTNYKQNEAKEFVIDIRKTFPSDSREGRIIYHSSLQAHCTCINDDIDTSSAVAWKCYTDAKPDLIENVACTVDEEVLDAVYLYGDNEVRQAKADNISTAQVLGFVVSKQGSTICTVQTRGKLSGFNGGGLSAGTQYFLSRNYAGGITDTPPTNEGDVLVRLGLGYSNDTLFIDIDRNVIRRS